MKETYFWRIITDQVVVPDHLQRETGLPGDPRGDICTGYARTRAELIPLARLDRANGGRPVISRVRPPTEEDRMRGDRHPVEVEYVPVRYEVRLSGVPDGAQVEDYLCGPSNGDGSPDRATRYFPTRKAAEQVVREFYAAKRARPQDFEPEMEATIVRL